MLFSQLCSKMKKVSRLGPCRVPLMRCPWFKAITTIRTHTPNPIIKRQFIMIAINFQVPSRSFIILLLLKVCYNEVSKHIANVGLHEINKGLNQIWATDVTSWSYFSFMAKVQILKDSKQNVWPQGTDWIEWFSKTLYYFCF